MDVSCSRTQHRTPVGSNFGPFDSVASTLLLGHRVPHKYDATITIYLSHHMGKPTICLGENKGTDQLRGNREADQRLCFRYTSSSS